MYVEEIVENLYILIFINFCKFAQDLDRSHIPRPSGIGFDFLEVIIILKLLKIVANLHILIIQRLQIAILYYPFLKLGPQCPTPGNDNGWAKWVNTESQEIYGLAWYSCEFDGPPKQSKMCRYDSQKGVAYWDRNIVCNQFRSGCLPHPDFEFDNSTLKKSLYSVGEIVKYLCPNGFVRRTKCTAINTQKDGKAVTIYDWNPNLSQSDCKGV